MDPVAELLSLCRETNLKRKCSKLHLQRLLGRHVLSEGAAAFLGFLSPVLAACRLAPFWPGYRVIVKSDSQVAAVILNKGSSHCPMIMAWTRDLFWLKEYFSFSLFVEHTPQSINTLADSVSCLDDVRHWPEF